MNAVETARVRGVRVAHWNPRRQVGLRPRRLFAWTKHTPLGPRVENFGDLLGPVVVAQLAERLRLPTHSATPRAVLGAVGSIIHMLPAGATVWGAGVNGKHTDLTLPQRLDIRAVRGPLTRRYLVERGVEVPEVFGDPALLIDYSRLGIARTGRARQGIVCVQNLNDSGGDRRPLPGDEISSVSPVDDLKQVVRAIDGAELVIGSSLHAIIVAEALGIPARAVRSDAESPFKYEDYYEGTGRTGVAIAGTVGEAVEMGGVDRAVSIHPALASAFPVDLWGPDRR